MGKPHGGILFDVKYILPKDSADAQLSTDRHYFCQLFLHPLRSTGDGFPGTRCHASDGGEDQTGGRVVPISANKFRSAFTDLLKGITFGNVFLGQESIQWLTA